MMLTTYRTSIGGCAGGVYDLNLDDLDPKTVTGAYEEQTLRPLMQ
jgi:hypothetical protein